MVRIVRRVGVAIAMLWLVLGTAVGVAHADPAVTAGGNCLTGGAGVANTTGTATGVGGDLDHSAVEPDFCDDFDISYDDKCETVTATVVNRHGSTVTISFVKYSGATMPLAQLTIPNGQTGSVDVPISADVYDIGAYLTDEGAYLNTFVVKGPGHCPATPTPSTTPSTTPAPANPGNLASTGNGSLVPITVAGLSMILAGVLALIALRRFSFR